MRSTITPLLASLGFGLAAQFAPSVAHAQQCGRLTRPIATRISAALRSTAPDWARALLTPAELVRFDTTNYHEMTYFLGYAMVNIERLGMRGAPPYRATVVVRCRDHRAELITDPYAWANARARELHVTVANAEQAAGYAAEVVSMSVGRRPDGASASRRAGVFQAEITFSPHQGDTAPSAPLHLAITRDGEISQSAAAGSNAP
jgi:hypothetical protein